MADDGQDTGDYGKRVPVEPQRAQGLSGRPAPALASPSSASVQCCFLQPNSLAFQSFRQLEEGQVDRNES
jgi:hypothetical protein